ncbi:MAG TPA: YfhO family protein [Candidatus Nitrosopolaris sp.]|nr:YfhO family protein [Candidatus Nitrosopolaris sp.]
MPISSNPVTGTEGADRDDWLTLRRFALLLALLALASYPQVWLGFQTFIYRDFGIFSYPIAYHFRESFWHGEIPLWNPLNNCGTPFLAQWNTQVLYPPALFYLLLPLSWSLGVFCLLHLFWGGLGMFVLARRWTHNQFAAAVAGIVFAFNGLMLNSLIWPATIAALGWMPWAVWLTERAWREGGRTIVLAACAGALQMLSGGTEVVLLTWILLAALHLAELIRGEFPRGSIVLRTGLVVLLVCGLSAAQLLPFFDLLDYSRRQQDVSAGMWPMPATGWANFFVPLFHCRSYQGVFMQDNQFWTNSYYDGVLTVVLALSAVWRARCGRVWLLAALALLALVLALGETTPVYGWLSRHVSAISLMRFPIKFVILPVFVLPLLAASTLSGKSSDTGGKFVGWAWGWIWFATVALVLGLVAWEWQSGPLNDDRRIVLLNGVMRAVFFTAIAAAWFFVNRLPTFKSRRWWQVSFLLLVWLDLFRQMPLPPTVNRAIYQPDLPRRWSAPQLGAARAEVPSAAGDALIHSFLPDVTADYLVRRFALANNCNLLDGIPKCDGFYPLYLSDYALLFYNFYDDSRPASPFLDLLGVSQTLMLQTNRYDWVARATFLSLLTAGQQPRFADDLTTLRTLTNADFHPRQEVYLPPEAKSLVTASNVVAATLSLVRFSSQRIEAAIETAAPTLVLVAQTYYHPWRAYVDGQPTRLWRANYAFQALEVPAGSHEVKLVYEDRWFHRGVIISLVTLAGCGIFYCFRRF